MARGQPKRRHSGGEGEDVESGLKKKKLPKSKVPQSETSEGRGGEHALLCLPSALLGRLWPAERVVLGRRVCSQLRRELSEHAGQILLVKRDGADGSINFDALSADFRRVSHLSVALRWHGEPAGLVSAAVLGTALIRLDLSHVRMSADGAGWLAGLLVDWRGLTHLDMGCNLIGDEGAEKLARVLGGCKALTHLDLSDTDLGGYGMRRMLAQCPALT